MIRRQLLKKLTITCDWMVCMTLARNRSLSGMRPYFHISLVTNEMRLAGNRISLTTEGLLRLGWGSTVYNSLRPLDTLFFSPFVMEPSILLPSKHGWFLPHFSFLYFVFFILIINFVYLGFLVSPYLNSLCYELPATFSTWHVLNCQKTMRTRVWIMLSISPD